MTKKKTTPTERTIVRWITALCLPLALLAGRCGRTDAGAKLELAIPAMPDGEAGRYRIRVAGDSTGALETAVFHDMFAQPGEEEPQPVYVFVSVTRAGVGAVPVTDSSVVYVNRGDLRPKSAFRFIRTGTALATTAANYGAHSVAVSSFASGREMQRLFPNNPRTFDADMLVLLARALKLDARKQVKVTVVSPMGPPFGGEAVEAELRWSGDEQVRVPAGSFDCRRVTMRLGEEETDFWFERTGTKRLVRYTTSGSGLVAELLPREPATPER